MRTTSLLVVAAVGLVVMTSSEGAEPSGWRPLFDGKSLDGWQHVGPGKMVP